MQRGGVGRVGLVCVLAGSSIAACADTVAIETGSSVPVAQEVPRIARATEGIEPSTDCPADVVQRFSIDAAPLPADVPATAAGSDLVVIARASGEQTVTAMTVPAGQPQPFPGPPLTQTAVSVVQVLRGEPAGELVVTQMGDRCTVGVPPILTPGRLYVLFLVEGQPGELHPYGGSATFEVVDGVATTNDPDVPQQSFTIDELERLVGD